MNKDELKKWLSNKKFGAVILVCPRCRRVDINPEKHLDECDPEGQSTRDYDWANDVGDR